MRINQVKKAVIPAAGFGTRLFPATKVVKKELFPIIDRDGKAKPVIQVIVEEAVSAGIEEIAIVTQPEDTKVFADYFQVKPHPELFKKLSPKNQEYSQYLSDKDVLDFNENNIIYQKLDMQINIIFLYYQRV